MAPHEYHIGLISGTSVDAIDCALGDFSGATPVLVASHSEPMPADLRQRLLAHCSADVTTLPALGRMDVELGERFAAAVLQMLDNNGLSPRDITTIGSHGQTLYHSPDGDFPFTLQIADPTIIAARTGIRTVADFRRMDMALGGQGAPLAPLFHQAAFHNPEHRRAVLNLGGIANLTFLPASREEPVSGLDTGPASALMDGWILKHQGKAYDSDGRWARSGSVHTDLLQHLLSDPYFVRPAPKSTGREYFSSTWLDDRLRRTGLDSLPPADVQATLLELSARTVIEGLRFGEARPEQLVVCGGGGRNGALMQRLRELARDIDVIDSGELGIPPDWVEGMTFAWLARRRWNRQAVDCTRLTGAASPALLGGIYEPPASDGE
ncbi:MAG: anhydro-N-acetylmuramic acid kinase [Pseudohongiellaceae bacterium]